MAGCQTKPVLWVKGSGWENWPNGNFSLLNAKLQRACVQMSESSKRSAISVSRQSGRTEDSPTLSAKHTLKPDGGLGNACQVTSEWEKKKRLSGVMETRLSLSRLEETRHWSSPSQHYHPHRVSSGWRRSWMQKRTEWKPDLEHSEKVQLRDSWHAVTSVDIRERSSNGRGLNPISSNPKRGGPETAFTSIQYLD